METKIPRTLDRVGINLKRKRATQYAAYLNRASQSVLSCMSPTNNLAKQRRLVRYERKLTNFGTHFRRPLNRCYFNYKNSWKLERLMFYQNGEWMDFPQDIIDLVRKDLVVKKTTMEVKFNSFHLVLDFLHMYHIDLKTGLQQPIAWTDETGCCFFPEVYAGDDSFFQDSYENGVDESKLSECNGESNGLVKHVQIDAYTECAYGKLHLDTVQKMFLKGMSSFGSSDVIGIYRCSSTFLKAQIELFQNQIEITKKCRGDANVQYGWLSISKEELSTMMKYGLGNCGLSRSVSTYGIGVCLATATCPYDSANYYDVDKNEVQHLVFCRVIMGNMELLRPGSGQSHPSSSDYDNGVDNIQSPRYYIVWNMNMNTHIYPEFVISFKVFADAEAVHKASWRSFSMIFAAISNKVSPEDKELIYTHYQQFKLKKMARDDFVNKLKLIVGDNLERYYDKYVMRDTIQMIE